MYYNNDTLAWDEHEIVETLRSSLNFQHTTSHVIAEREGISKPSSWINVEINQVPSAPEQMAI